MTLDVAKVVVVTGLDAWRIRFLRGALLGELSRAQPMEHDLIRKWLAELEQ